MAKIKPEDTNSFKFLLETSETIDFLIASEADILKWVNKYFPKSLSSERKMFVVDKIIEEREKVKKLT